MFLSTLPVFELTFTPERYRLRIQNDEDETEELTGALLEFPGERPDMAGLF